MHLEFWGVRGTAPVSGRDMVRYGGHTPCAALRSSAGDLLIIDAGTGIKRLGERLMAESGKATLEVDLLLLDTTSTYFERDGAEADVTDAEGNLIRPAFRVYGKSKDHRDDLPQVVIGLAVTRSGIPIRVWCWPGNASDQELIRQVKDDLRAWKLTRVLAGLSRTAMAMVPARAFPVLTSWPFRWKRMPLRGPSSTNSLKLPALFRSQTKDA